MTEKMTLQAIIYGRVQGVCFRDFVRQKAVELDLTGYTRNLPSGNEVEVLAEGNIDDLKKFLKFLNVGPQGSSVSKVTVNWTNSLNKFKGFEIHY
jgi:acylphosphatase